MYDLELMKVRETSGDLLQRFERIERSGKSSEVFRLVDDIVKRCYTFFQSDVEEIVMLFLAVVATIPGLVSSGSARL